MKPIDYAAIIEKANVRKEALQAFELKLGTICEEEKKLNEALTYFAELGDLVNKIDQEGRTLLGPASEMCLSFVSSARAAADTIYRPSYSSKLGLQALMELLK